MVRHRRILWFVLLRAHLLDGRRLRKGGKRRAAGRYERLAAAGLGRMRYEDQVPVREQCGPLRERKVGRIALADTHKIRPADGAGPGPLSVDRTV